MYDIAPIIEPVHAGENSEIPAPCELLATLPRMALVIGNAGYPRSPLRNPVNDAKAISHALQQNAFQVDLLLDPARERLADAIRAFTQELDRNKGVGFFFYAGHGAQHEWRNYLIPVDAAVGSCEDLPGGTVELNSLLHGLTAAGNAMNVVVLDACRDNPFGPNVPAEGRGLAQFDAPAGTLLAYAAAPGTTIGDSELYAASLVHELHAADTDIANVFRRVRLAVRRESEGRQVPWESTALKDDFRLRPPVHPDTQLNKTQAFEAELALWDKSRRLNDAASLEAYLHRYPGGMFSELGEYRLERLLAHSQQGTVFAALAPNPFSKGAFRADPDFAPGDSYTYQSANGVVTETVTRVTRSRVVYDHGQRVLDFLGNELSSRILPSSQLYPAVYALGRKWQTRFYDADRGLVEMTLRIVGKEMISVPAGTFDAFRIEGDGLGSGGDHIDTTAWVAPDVCRRPLAIESVVRSAVGTVTEERSELAAFQEKITPAPASRQIGAQVTRQLALCNRVTAHSSCSA